ncbi:hypothetical protein B9Q02_01965 [Candidatus Marsarchaeota G1 archaeon BE_D]|jgi:Uncharacterized conserved protein|uniref:N-acetyltransferase domain-containing protein n=2 Tax=Candidatus Marsarchaeota TaxID=1978152 RepID=A0A2R6AJH6_9ARCH|nr:MAG: hypothetical protein B9Q02_01965 [Candidatus Marsarchaeota G1 archaeon BE_D]
MNEISIRELHTVEELSMAEQVQKLAWGMPDIMVTPKEIMRAIASNGGLVLGAFYGEKMVGMSLSFVGRRKNKLYMYSHMTGVSREYQSQGVGYLLKQKQRELSLKMGYELIAWTFDPLIARNAHFNMSKLGTITRTYLRNYYGEMNDEINFGLDTDRVIAEWWSERSVESARKHALSDLEDCHYAIESTDSQGDCKSWSVDPNAKKVLVQIPSDIVALKRVDLKAAQRWRLATREVFEEYFKAGYAALAFLKLNGRLYYVLAKAQLPENVFSE